MSLRMYPRRLSVFSEEHQYHPSLSIDILGLTHQETWKQERDHHPERNQKYLLVQDCFPFFLSSSKDRDNTAEIAGNDTHIGNLRESKEKMLSRDHDDQVEYLCPQDNILRTQPSSSSQLPFPATRPS